MQKCDSAREVSHGSHRSHGFSSSQATVLTKAHSKNSEGVKIREIRGIRVPKQCDSERVSQWKNSEGVKNP